MSTSAVNLDFSKAVPIAGPSQPQPQQSAPTQQQPQVSTPNSTGVTLDFSKAQPITNAPPASTSSSNGTSNSGGILGTAEGFASGIGKELTGTVAGIDDGLSHVPVIGNWLTSPITSGHSAAASQAVRNTEHAYSDSTDPNHATAEALGRGTAGLGEILLTDGAMQGLNLSQRLLQAGKLADAVESSPALQRIVSAGIRAIRGGAASAAVTATNTESAGDAVNAGLTGGIVAGVVPEIPGAIGAVRKPFSLSAVRDALQNTTQDIAEDAATKTQAAQDAFHQSLRGVLNDVAKDADVKPAQAPSLRDAAQQTAAAVKAKASGLYKQLDAAVGGTRFQTFDEQISNVRRALRNSAGIDPDADGKLTERLNDLEDAKAKALADAQAKGVDPNLIHEANRAYRQGSALEDLSRHIRASASGLRPELAEDGTNAAPEAVSPSKLATRANRLYDTGRLQQALGPDGADDLLRATEGTRQQVQNIAQDAVQRTEAAKANAAERMDAVRRNRLIGGTVAAGLGAPKAWHLLQHLLGE